MSSTENIPAKVRELIKKDEIEKAFEWMQAIVPPELNNAQVVIVNRYKKWRKDKMLGIGNSAGERNAIVNDLLDLLSDIEKINNTGADDEPDIVHNENIAGNFTTGAVNMMRVHQGTPTPPPASKPWYEKISVLVPVIVALISGLFLIWQTYLSKDRKDTAGKSVTYELIFVDFQTLRPPVFRTPDPRVRIYSRIPPEVLPITLGTVKFDGPASLENQKIIIELENITGYQIADRNQVIKAGRNEIFITPVKEKAEVPQKLPMRLKYR